MLLRFDVIDASLTEEYGGYVSLFEDSSDSPLEPIKEITRDCRLSLHLRLAEDQRVNLSTGEQLEKLDGYIQILQQVPEVDKPIKGIGSLSYFQGMFEIKVILPTDQYNDLLLTARSGRTPSVVNIRVRGLTSDSSSSVGWNIESSQYLFISSISFNIPLAEINQDGVVPRMANYLPTSRSDIIYLVKGMRELWIAIHDIKESLNNMSILFSRSTFS